MMSLRPPNDTHFWQSPLLANPQAGTSFTKPPPESASWSGPCSSLLLLELCALAELNLHCSLWSPSHSFLHLGGAPFPIPLSSYQIIFKSQWHVNSSRKLSFYWFRCSSFVCPYWVLIPLYWNCLFTWGPLLCSKRAGLCLPIHTASPELGLGSGTWLVLSEIWVMNEGSLLCFFVLSTGLSLLAHSRLSMKICWIDNGRLHE